MEEKISHIAKNTSYFTLALVLQKIVSFTYFTILARNLVPADLGKYYFAISFTTIFAIFIDIGLANVLTREIAKKDKPAGQILQSALFIKIPLAAATLIFTIIAVNWLGYPALTRQLVYLSSVCMVLDSFVLIFFSTIRGFHNLFFESLASICFQLIALIFGLFVLYFQGSLLWLMGAFIAASVFNFIYSGLIVWRKYKIRIIPRYHEAVVKTLLIITLPFGIYGILQRLFTYLDTVLISLLAGDKYVGLYQIAFKIVVAMQFLPMAFVASLYPAFSLYWRENREQLSISFERSMNYLIIISLPIAFGIIALAGKIVSLFKTDYTDSIVLLRIIMLALFFIFLNFPIGSLLNACDRQKANTVNMGITLVFSVLLNIFLIPLTQKIWYNGAIGASLTVVAANLLMFILGLRIVPEITKIRGKRIATAFLKVAASSFTMSFFAWILKDSVNIFLIIAVCAPFYFILLYLLGGFKKEDLASVLNSLKRVKEPVPMRDET